MTGEQGGQSSDGAEGAARTVADAAPRRRVDLSGTLLWVRTHGGERMEGRGPWLDAGLHDGTGMLVLRWWGRRSIPGLRPGAPIAVTGMAGLVGGHLVVLNPAYRFEHDLGPPPDGA